MLSDCVYVMVGLLRLRCILVGMCCIRYLMVDLLRWVGEGSCVYWCIYFVVFLFSVWMNCENSFGCDEILSFVYICC